MAIQRITKRDYPRQDSAKIKEKLQEIRIRERDILILLCKGKTLEDIGLILSISRTQVSESLRVMKDRFEASDNVELVIKALKAKIINLEDIIK